MWKLRAIPHVEDGHCQGVCFPDLPGVYAFGPDYRTALRSGVRSATYMMCVYIREDRALPLARTNGDGRQLVDIPPTLAAKLTLRRAMHARGWTVTQLAGHLEVSQAEAKALLDLDVPADASALRAAFAKMKPIPAYRAGTRVCPNPLFLTSTRRTISG